MTTRFDPATMDVMIHVRDAGIWKWVTIVVDDDMAFTDPHRIEGETVRMSTERRDQLLELLHVEQV